MSEWRYIAQRALTGEFLDWELPLQRDELSWALSGAGSLRGRLAPDIGGLRAADGRLVLEEWGTYIYAESGGQIRWGGIVISSAFNGEEWEVEAAGFTTYPNGMPYTGSYSRIGVDPATVIADIWGHLQSQPDGNLGVVVRGTSTPTRLGKAEVPAYDEVFLDGKWQRKSAVSASRIIPSAKAQLKAGISATSTSLTLKTLDNFGKIPLPFNVVIGSETITVGARDGLVLKSLTRGVGSSSPAAHGAGTYAKFTGTQTRTVDKVPAEPYELQWFDAPDCGQEIDSLVGESGIEYVEQHSWESASSEVIKHEVILAYPRVGRRRDDLAFVQGDNVIEVVKADRPGDEFANAIIGIGAGEGKAEVYRTTGQRDGRLRRARVYTDKAVKSASRMDSRIKAQLIRRRALLEIDEVVVRDHPNAPIGSWSVGDDIEVRASLPWLGDVALWCRVVEWSLVTDDVARLVLKRSDSFTYGG